MNQSVHTFCVGSMNVRNASGLGFGLGHDSHQQHLPAGNHLASFKPLNADLYPSTRYLPPGLVLPGIGFRAVMVVACVPIAAEVHNMRTNIEIDDKLMKDALRATGARTKKEAVELGLRTLLDLRAQEKARELRGKITWEGDLNAIRTDK